VFIALALATLSTTTVGSAHGADPVRAAIVRAAAARLGAGVEVVVESVQVTATSVTGPLVARPEPAARLGRPSVFALTVNTNGTARRVGSAVVVLTAVAPCLIATRDVPAGQVLTSADFAEAHRAIADAPLKPMPLRAEATGAYVKRELKAGDVVTSTNIRFVPLVSSGQQVLLRAIVGGIEARGVGVAVESGQQGSVIRVVNPDSRKTLVGRIVAAGEVEVVHGS
jgi:flagella basal body P-ring formation protein FlgA